MELNFFNQLDDPSEPEGSVDWGASPEREKSSTPPEVRRSRCRLRARSSSSARPDRTQCAKSSKHAKTERAVPKRVPDRVRRTPKASDKALPKLDSGSSSYYSDIDEPDKKNL